MSTLKTNNIQHVDRSDPSIIINTDGSVNIAGTMTYEDVTNVDSVGIITGRELINAQKQVHVGTGVSVKAGGLNVTAGITTVQALQATTGTFSGDVDIADKIIHTGDTNTAIRFPASNTVTLETDGSERLRITSDGTIGQGLTSPEDLFHISTAENAAKGLRITNTNNSQASAIARVFISGGDNAKAALRLETNGAYHDIFERNTGELTIEDNGSEKLRLDSSGRLLLGTTTAYGASGTGTMMVSVKADGGSRTDISVSNQSSVDNASAAVVLATHGQDYILEATGSGNSTDGARAFRILKGTSERLRIDTNGRVSISDNTRPAGDVNEGAQLRVNGTPITRNQYYSPAGDYYGSFGYTDNTYTKSWIAVDSAYAKSSAISAGVFLSAFHQDSGGSACGFTIKNLKDGNPLVFSSVVTGSSTGNPAVETERLRITSAGVFGFNKTDPEGKGIDVTHSRTNAYSATTDTRNLAHIICRNSSDAAGRFAALSFINGGGTQAEGSINLVQTGSYTGDLAIKIRTAVSTWGEKARFLSSGGITFNGDTATANALDDYEEGTWTPSATPVTLTGTIAGHYTKIGDLCYVSSIFVIPTNSNTSDIIINGLPFNGKNGTDGNYIQGGFVTYHNQGGGPYGVLVTNNSNQLVVYKTDGARQTFNQFSNRHLRISAVYKVA